MAQHHLAPPSAADPPGPGLTRRQMLIGSLAAVGGVVAIGSLAGCTPANASADGVRQLAFWHLLSGGDGINMAGLVDDVNALDHGYEATQTVLAWGAPYYTKLAMASVGGRAPDTAIMHASRVAGYAPGGLLDPWDLDLLAENGVQESDFLDRGLGQGRARRQAVLDRPRLAPVHHDVQPRRRRAGRGPRQRRAAGADRQPGPVPRGRPGHAGRDRQARAVLRVPRRRRPDVAAVLHALQAARRRLRPVRPARPRSTRTPRSTSLEFIQQLLDGTICTPSGDYGTAVSRVHVGGERDVLHRRLGAADRQERRPRVRRPADPDAVRHAGRLRRLARVHAPAPVEPEPGAAAPRRTGSSRTSSRTRSRGPRPGTSRRSSRSCRAPSTRRCCRRRTTRRPPRSSTTTRRRGSPGRAATSRTTSLETVQNVYLERRRSRRTGFDAFVAARQRPARPSRTRSDRKESTHVHRSTQRRRRHARRLGRRPGPASVRRATGTTASAGRSSRPSSSSSSMFLIWPLIHGFYLSFTGESITGANGELHRLRELRRGARRTRSCGARCCNTLWFTVLSTDPARGRLARPRAARPPGAARPVAVAALVLHAVPARVDRRRADLDLDVQPAARARERRARRVRGRAGGVAAGSDVGDVRRSSSRPLWWTVGFNFLLYLTALQNIPEQQYEASAHRRRRADGGSCRSITIPQLGPTTVLIVMLQILASLKVFDQIYMHDQRRSRRRRPGRSCSTSSRPGSPATGSGTRRPSRTSSSPSSSSSRSARSELTSRRSA